MVGQNVGPGRRLWQALDAVASGRNTSTPPAWCQRQCPEDQRWHHSEAGATYGSWANSASWLMTAELGLQTLQPAGHAAPIGLRAEGQVAPVDRVEVPAGHQVEARQEFTRLRWTHLPARRASLTHSRAASDSFHSDRVDPRFGQHRRRSAASVRTRRSAGTGGPRRRRARPTSRRAHTWGVVLGAEASG